MDTLQRLLPTIRRTRGNRLYLANNKRLLDLYLDDGYRFLSYQDVKTRTYACNAVSKGITGIYPGLYEKRFTTALRQYLGRDFPILVFPSEASALHCLQNCTGKQVCTTEIWPRKQDSDKNIVIRLRPFLPLPEQGMLMFPIPCVRSFAPVVLIFCDEAQYLEVRSVYEADTVNLYQVPAINYYVGTRAINSLLRLHENGYHEKHWQAFMEDSSGAFINTGPYIYPASGDYISCFKLALDTGILLNPHANAPSIIPMEYSSGELKKFIAACKAS